MKKQDKPDITNDGNISSAEMTAYWRSEYPELSGDFLSKCMADQAGISKAVKFAESYDYPMIGRKVSVRAGHILHQAIQALSTNAYDSCISLASGFSLLGYYIALAMHHQRPQLRILDTDLPHMVLERQERLKKLEALLDEQAYLRTFNQALDLEKAFKEGKNFKDLFAYYKSPVFIIEGVIYFLSQQCVDWIFNQIATYDSVAVIFDYWPDNSVNVSQCFARVFATLNQVIPEQVKSFWHQPSIRFFSKFSSIDDQSIQQIENKMSILIGEKPRFIDVNKFFPVRMITARKENRCQIRTFRQNCYN